METKLSESQRVALARATSRGQAVSFSRGSVSPRLTPRQCRGFPSLGETRPRGFVGEIEKLTAWERDGY